MAGCITDHPNKQVIKHSLEAFLPQRMGALLWATKILTTTTI